MKLRAILILAVVGILFFLSVNGVFSPKGHAPSGQPAFVELDPQNLDSLRQSFNAADAQTRVVLWVAPT